MSEGSSDNFIAFALGAAMIIFGTASTELSKVQFETRSVGIDTCDKDDDGGGTTKNCYFEKPYFNTLIMKFGMSLLYFAWMYERSLRRKKTALSVKMEQGGQALIASTDLDDPTRGSAGSSMKEPDFSVILRIMVPACTDLVQTVLAMAGLLWVNSSIYQMSRGSVVIFSAILSYYWLDRALTPSQIIAVLFVLVSIIFVGIAGIEESEDGDDDSGSSVLLVIIGLALIVGGQFIGAIQFILEEELMTRYNVAPTQLVAWEGIWGFMMLVILYVPLYFTPSGGPSSEIWHENFIDACVQLSNSTVLIATTVVSVFVLMTYNLVGNLITKYLNAVARSMLEACRTIGVWGFGLAYYYTTGNTKVGEQWTNWSYLELAGFFLLVYGTMAYKDIVPINPLDLCFKKKSDDDDDKSEISNQSAYNPLSTDGDDRDRAVDKTSV